jgi:hypothetical protein
MAWKFLNIGKANAEIDRLEAELAKASAGSSAPPDKIVALEKRLEDLAASMATLGESVAALEKAISASGDSFKVEIARLDKSFTEFQTSAKEIGSRLAAEITARQGQPPLAAGNTSGTQSGGGADIIAQFNAITDPVARTEWYRKNKVAYDAAWTAANRK